MKQKESDIQRKILTYLQVLENKKMLYYIRTGSGAIQTEKGTYFKSGRPGAPDITVCYKGVAVFLECKVPGGRQTKSQKIAQEKINYAYGYYFIVSSIEDVKKAFRLIEYYLNNKRGFYDETDST